MCTQRILQRLRLLQSKWHTPKQPIQDVLRVAMDSLKRLGLDGLGPKHPGCIDFTRKAKDVIKTVDTYMKYQKTSQLKDVVDAVHQLNRVEDLEAMFSKVNNRDMAPTSRKNLINIVSKVARYREIARYLHRSSKKCGVLRFITFTAVKLPTGAYTRPTLDKYNPALVSCLKRIDNSYSEAVFSQMCRSIGMTDVEGNERFSSQTTKTLRQAKIHAEIQLLYYLELNLAKIPPRIIASSKDACSCATASLPCTERCTPLELMGDCTQDGDCQRCRNSLA